MGSHRKCRRSSSVGLLAAICTFACAPPSIVESCRRADINWEMCLVSREGTRGLYVNRELFLMVVEEKQVKF
jgi:hypothetical protein